jgi:hypothetical protein
MKKLTSATIDVVSLTTIGYSMFSQDVALNKVEVKNANLQFFAGSTFYGCTELETVLLPEVSDEFYYASSYSSYSGYSYSNFQYIVANCSKLKTLSNINAFEKFLEEMDAEGSMGYSFPFDAPAFAPDEKTGLSISGTLLFGGKTVEGAVVVPAYITTISKSAFKGGVLTSLSVAEGSQLTTIKDSAFMECANLKSVDLSNATLLETVGTNLFERNTSLTSVVLSESEKFTALSNNMFAGSNTARVPLTSITIPKNITSIGDTVFSYTNITSVTFDKDIELTSVGTYLFSGTLMTSEQANKVLKDLAKAIKADANGDVTLPSYLFYLNDTTTETNITSLIIPEEFTIIAQRAFNGLRNLTSVTFEGYDATTNGSTSKLRTIENYVFDETAITSFVYQPNMTATYAFNGLPLETVKFANGCALTSVVNNSFKDTKITEIELPSTVTAIGNNAFSGTEITKIVLPAGLTSLGNAVFQKCTELASVTVGEGTVNTLPASITTIPQNTFNACEKLTSFEVADGVTSIGNSAFASSGLESIVLSETVKGTLGTLAFASTPLSSVTVRKADGTNDGINTVPKLVTSVSTAFQGCSKLTSFVIPSTVTTKVPAKAFENCTSLATLTVPGNLGYNAATCFSGCSALKTVYITKGSNANISNSGTTAYKSSTYNYTPWYQVNANGGGNVVIGAGITNVTAYAFYNETKLSIFVEAASIATKAANNGNLTSGTNVYYGLDSTWEYVNGVPTVK